MESQPVPYERKMLYLLVGGLLLLAGSLLLIFWNPDEFAVAKLLIMYVCLILGSLLVGAQLRDAYLRRGTRISNAFFKLSQVLQHSFDLHFE